MKRFHLHVSVKDLDESVPVGVNHLGFQLDSDAEWRAMQARLQSVDSNLIQEDEQSCCYARSEIIRVAPSR